MIYVIIIIVFLFAGMIIADLISESFKNDEPIKKPPEHDGHIENKFFDKDGYMKENLFPD